MARVTQDQVKSVIVTSIDDVGMFVETAAMIVDEQLNDKGMTDARLTKIELFLAAHFVTLRERQKKSEAMGTSSADYEGVTRMNLQASLYGQTAISLDTSSTLFALGRPTTGLVSL